MYIDYHHAASFTFSVAEDLALDRFDARTPVLLLNFPRPKADALVERILVPFGKTGRAFVHHDFRELRDPLYAAYLVVPLPHPIALDGTPHDAEGPAVVVIGGEARPQPGWGYPNFLHGLYRLGAFRIGIGYADRCPGEPFLNPRWTFQAIRDVCPDWQERVQQAIRRYAELRSSE